MMVSNSWHHFHFWVNYPFKSKECQTNVKYTVLEGRLYQMIKGLILAEVWFYNNDAALCALSKFFKKKNSNLNSLTNFDYEYIQVYTGTYGDWTF